MDYDTELALMLFMEEFGQSDVKDTRVAEGCVVEQASRPTYANYFEPGRKHLAAEVGGRIATPKPAHKESEQGPDAWLKTFDAGYRTSSFQPLEIDPRTKRYCGTIFWSLDR